ncbi:pleiotropic regulatory protein RsmS [Agarivorans litoreus]|uniref:pleiotropic regulatory protein RsmS n=1 Tax=Agarivorans litoreus TaxID=1510455 RepID=UPI001C7D68DF|nr:pleiotropic regulatory protein RsmS [Agarivorans litoreus]
MSLNTAPKHIQLAVDLIQLLEENHIEPELALKALEIVTNDCQQKIAKQSKLED